MEKLPLNFPQSRTVLMKFLARFFSEKFLDINVEKLGASHLRTLIREQGLFCDGVPQESSFLGMSADGWAVFSSSNTVDSEGDCMRSWWMVHPKTREILHDWQYEERVGSKQWMQLAFATP